MMSPDEVRARYRLYTAYYASCGISPYRRMLASLIQLRHSIFKESFAQTWRKKAHIDPDLIATVQFCAIGLLVMLIVMLSFPDLGTIIAQYNQF